MLGIAYAYHIMHMHILSMPQKMFRVNGRGKQKQVAQTLLQILAPTDWPSPELPGPKVRANTVLNGLYPKAGSSMVRTHGPRPMLCAMNL